MRFKCLFLSFIFVFVICNTHAQVTVGLGEEPEKGALMQLKDTEADTDNVTAKKGGLLMPRVKLEDRAALLPFIPNNSDFQNNANGVKSKHTGLSVYNLTDDYTKGFCPGLYTWNGSLWDRISQPCITFEFLCATIATDSYSKPRGNAFSEANTIHYNSKVAINITTAKTHSYGNGLSITIPKQNLPKGNGTLTFAVQSDGTTASGNYRLPLSQLAQELDVEITSSCEVFVVITGDLSSFTLLCDGAEAEFIKGVAASTTVDVSYSEGQTPQTISVGAIGSPVNGIIPLIVDEQTLNSTTGTITVTLAGTPTSSGTFSLPITIDGSSCNITLNVRVPFLIECDDIYVTGYLEEDMSTTATVASIQYTLSEGSYTLNAGNVGTFNNVTASIKAQELRAPGGVIEVSFSGVPATEMSLEQFSITIDGNSCSFYLSVMDTPAACDNGFDARAFVFQQDGKWYVVTGDGNYSGNSVARVIECATEHEALSHPQALQYCGATEIENPRCIRLHNRQGQPVKNIYMTQTSSGWGPGLLFADGVGCFASVIAYSGTQPRATYPATKNLGMVNISGQLYFGVITGTSVMTTNPLR